MKLTMISGQSQRTLKLSTLLLLAIFSLTTQAQQTAAANQSPATAQGHPAATPNREEEEAAKPPKPGGEGIRIHGHWIIEVKNPDGTIAQHRDFENGLVSGPGLGMLSGDQLLAAILTGGGVPGGFGIALISGPVTTPGYDKSAFCATGYPGQVPAPAGIKCFGMYEPNSVFDGFPGGPYVLKIAQTVLTSRVTFEPPVSIVLSGNFTVLGSYGLTSIDGVQTYLGMCTHDPNFFGPTFRLVGTSIPFGPADINPKGCGPAHNGLYNPILGAFTSTNVPTPLINLVTGQVISVQVTLSFS